MVHCGQAWGWRYYDFVLDALGLVVGHVCNMTISKMERCHATSMTYGIISMNIRRYYIPGTALFFTQVVQYREPESLARRWSPDQRRVSGLGRETQAEQGNSIRSRLPSKGTILCATD